MSPNRPILIHRVIGRLNVGGPAMHVVNLARALDDGVRFRTRLIVGSVPAGEGDMEYYAAERGVELVRVPEMSREVSPLDDARATVRLARLFRRERPDVVHTHTAKAGAVGRAAAILARAPVLVHTYHGHVLGGDYFSPAVTAFYRGVERALARATDRLVVLTEAQRAELAGEHRVAAPDRFRVVPLGLELDRFADVDRPAERAAARAELGLPKDAPVVGIVGRLVPIKNHELLLHAVARLRAGSAPGAPAVSARVLVVGGGAREAELRALADSLGLGDAVWWAGWRTDLPRMYAAMDVLALTSRDEGTPVAVIEALAAGTPVVARAVGGVPELLGGGELGRLVDADDPDALARALSAALAGARAEPQGGADGGLAGPAARRRVVERFSVERLAADLAALYEEVLERRAVARRRGTSP